MLHIVNRLPLEPALIERTAQGDALLLIESAVYAARRGGATASMLERASRSLRVCVLGPDLTARGIADDELIAGVEIVDYGGFVTLTVEHEIVHSWL